MGDLLRSFRRLSQKIGPSWHRQFETQHHHVRLLKKLYSKHGLELIQTSSMSPEQYEIFKHGIQVGYYRLRHGEFRIHIPNYNDEPIFEAFPDGDGMFDKNERLVYMTNAMRLIISKLQ